MTIIRQIQVGIALVIVGLIVSCLLIWELIAPKDWAAWAQAVGSIGALLITGGLFLLQRQVEDKKAEDASLKTRTVAAQNIVAVATHAVQAMHEAANEHETDTEHGVFEESASRLEHLRSVLDSFIAPNTDQECVAASLHLAKLLTQARADFQNHNRNYGIIDIVHTRSASRVRNAEVFRIKLINHQNRLMAECRARNIPLSDINIDN